MLSAHSRFSLCRNKAWAIACLFFVGLFIFSHTNGNLSTWGDDIFFISHSYSTGGTYLSTISGRGYLTRYYSAVYDLMHHSIWAVHLFNFGLFAVSVLLCYAVARRFLGRSAALIASLYYLAFVDKYDIVTCNSAGAYLLATITFFLSIWLALSPRLGPWMRGLLIGLINWVTAHLCEILLVVMPLYPLLFVIYRWKRRQPVFCRELLPTFLPLTLFLMHWFLMFANTSKTSAPIWVRNADVKMNASSVPAMAGNAFLKGISGTLGPDHLRLLNQGLRGFFHHYVPKTPWIVGTFLLSVVVLAIYFRQLGKQIESDSPNNRSSSAVYWTILAAALYLILFSPVIGFPIIAGGQNSEMPSRFLVLSGIGVALLLGFAVEITAKFALVRRIVLLLALALIYLEAFAFHSILYEYQTSAAYDRNIRSQLKELKLEPKIGDTIFISLGRHRYMNNYWKTASSQYENRNVEPLLILDYDMVNAHTDVPSDKRLRYLNQIREKDDDLLNIPLDATSLRQYQTLYPLYLSNPDEKLFILDQIQIVDDAGHVLRTLDFPTSAKSSPPTKIGRASSVFIDNTMINADRKISLNFFDPKFTLHIQGSRWNEGSPGIAQLWQDDKLVAAKKLDQPGDFSWEIPLNNSIQPEHSFTLRTVPATLGQTSATWTVKSIALHQPVK